MTAGRVGLLACAVLVWSPSTGTEAWAAHRAQVRPIATTVPLVMDGTTGKDRGIHPAGTVVRHITFPAHAHQGPARWWVMRLVARLSIRRAPKPSLIDLTGFTNGRASIQVEIVVPARGDTRHRVHWEAYGWLDGLVRRTVSRRSFVVDARNYLQYGGVTPGRARFSVQVEQFGGRAFRGGYLSAKTLIVGGYPTAASMDTALVRSQLRVDGRTVRVPLAFANRGGRAAVAIKLKASYDDQMLKLLHISPRFIHRLPAGRTARAVATFRVLRPGRTSIRFGESDAVRSSGTSLALALPRTDGGDSSGALLGFLPAALLFIAGGVAFAVSAHASSRRLLVPRIGLRRR